ncbi:PilN domain-containing protein [Planctomycetota bacterium]
MIRINLLPEELRPLEKTPLGRFLIIVFGVMFSTAALFLFLVLQFKTLPVARQQKASAESTKKQKTVEAKRFDELKKEIDFFKLRIDTVNRISQERYIWSRKLHQLHKVIAEDSPDVSLKQVVIEQKAGVGVGAVPKMEIVIEGYSIIPELKAAADFMKNLRKSDFFHDCEDINPENTVVRDGEKGTVCEFTLRVIMKPRIIAPKQAGRRA